jgi:hypothetical protein
MSDLPRPQATAGRPSRSLASALGPEPATNGATPAIAEPGLHIVDVRDRVNAELGGHTGCAYTSPPQPREQALVLVAALLGCAVAPPAAHDTWTRAVAGGQRTIALRAAPPPAGPPVGHAPEAATGRARELRDAGT